MKAELEFNLTRNHPIDDRNKVNKGQVYKNSTPEKKTMIATEFRFLVEL